MIFLIMTLNGTPIFECMRSNITLTMDNKKDMCVKEIGYMLKINNNLQSS